MDDEDDVLDGEVVELDDEILDVEDAPDGGAFVRLDEDDESPEAGEFYGNLAEVLPDSVLNKLATEYLQLIEYDRQARKPRDEQYAEGLKRTGMGKDAPGGADFEGASTVVHPMLTEVCVDFNSRAIKELMPAAGPVKTEIIGKTTRKRVAKAERKAALLNWQLTTQVKGFRSELEQLLTQLPLGGAQYVKVRWNEARNRPTFEFVPVDHIILPFAATNFYTAGRKAHMLFRTEQEYAADVRDGLYIDVNLISPSMLLQETESGKANDKIEGRTETTQNEDGIRVLFEIACELDIEEEYGPAPYLMTIDETSQRVVGLYRNWREEDDTHEAMDHIVEFPFVPWRGAYPIGIVQMIGGLNAAATGALRALLDSAHISNLPGLLKLGKQGRPGQSITVSPTEIKEIEAPPSVDDIRKTIMPIPYNGPSATLFQLLGFLVDAGRDVIRTTFDDFSDNNQNVPVGTTLAKIEQGMVVFSAIHARLHDAMARLLMVLHRLNAMYLDEEKLEAEAGEKLALRSDFNGPLDVRPVSDPNIFSEAQRFAQMQAVAQRAQLMPALYNAREVEERILQTLKVPDAQKLLAPKMQPVETNAVEESVKVSLGQPVTAFPDQNHIAHLQVHLAFIKSPTFGSNPLIAPTALPILLNHIKEHMVLWFAAETFKEAAQAVGNMPGLAEGLTDEDGEPLSGDNPEDLLRAMIRETTDKEDKQQLDELLAQAALNVMMGANEAFKSLPPVIAEAMDMVKKLTPPPVEDPALKAALAETQRRAADDQAKDQREKLALQLKAQENQQEQQLEAARMAAEAQERAVEQQRETAEAQAEAEFKEREIDAKVAMNDADNATALEMTEMQVDSKIEAAKLKPPNPNPNSNQNPGKSPNPNPDPGG